jgi:hypothetical protein
VAVVKQVWLNIAASNNAWSSGVTPAHLAAIAKAAPAVQVFDVPEGSLLGVTGPYEIRADGCELWSLCELEREPSGEGKYHAEAVLMREPDGAVKLWAVAVTSLPRGAIQAWMARRYAGRVGRL